MISLKKIFENMYMMRKPDISSKDVNQKELKKGLAVEVEHTDDIELAKIIALHHLAEFPDYYTRLDKMEKKAKKEEK